MNILTAYFNTRLVNAGFPDGFEIRYSLGHCQGDGVAFYGDIPPDYWLGLFKKVYPEQKRRHRMFERLLKEILGWEHFGDDISIYRNHFGNRYSHFNTMEIEAVEATDFVFFSDFQARKDWYFPADEVYKYHALWDDFITDLEEYIRDLSRELEREGYRIIDATPYEETVAYKFETKNYRVEFITAPHDFFANNFETFMYDCDFESVEELCSCVLDGNTAFANVYAQVVDKPSGCVLGEDYFGYLVYNPEDKHFGGYKQILIREAIQAARANDGLISRQAQLMQKYL